MEKKERKQMFQVLAKPISYALIVDARQADAFLKHKPNPAMKECKAIRGTDETT